MYVYIHLYIFIHLYIYIYIYAFIYIYIRSSICIPFVIIALYYVIALIYVNLEIVISPRWHEAFRISSMTVAKVPLFPSFENMEIFVEVLRSTTK